MMVIPETHYEHENIYLGFYYMKYSNVRHSVVSIFHYILDYQKVCFLINSSGV